MTKKKVLPVILAAAMALSMTACGSSSKPAESADAKAEGAAASGDKIDLTLWHIQTGATAEIVQQSAERFMADNPQYNVTVVQKQNDSYKTDLSLAINAGTMPDVFLTWGGQTLYDYIDEGLVCDLTEYMNADNYKDNYLDAAVEQCTYNDSIYAVPIENVSVAGFFYNKEVFEQYNLEEPKTIAELEKVCDTLVENGISPFALANATKWTGSMYYQYLATRFGGLEPFAAAAAGDGSFEDEAFVYAGEKIQEWVEKGYFCEGFNGMDDDSGQARMLFFNGDAAMDLMGSWFVSNVADESTMLEDDTLGFFPFPELETSDANQTYTLGTLGDNLYSVSAKCADTEGAFKLITYLLDDEAVAARKAQGKIIPLKDFEADNDVVNEILDTLGGAAGVQLWYDQYLPSEVAEVHKSTSQEIFGLTKTPQDANAEMQKAIDTYLGK
ncbi:MAG: extracellular solute-binding protein [Lachnospiraceae bacterium]|nr:extracellular solute-binding protein [Lachnospiraceae bacterium]